MDMRVDLELPGCTHSKMVESVAMSLPQEPRTGQDEQAAEEMESMCHLQWRIVCQCSQKGQDGG